jgi:hypothetical protein
MRIRLDKEKNIHMTLDNNNAYSEKFYPDQQEVELDVYSNCGSCGEILFVGDEAIDWHGSVCCNVKDCILKMIDAREVILESGEE